ncbi:hypothetical protein COY07_03680 [Candidatus Peregrinibacteria bacterium CG_4_10_14_0_2_um_filter_43_11]|nr:MAG: hypothetical protein COY07_03680 [Candidatus Peregrinibacteria bacterium CG_4_10_14_0_2_um_filter_43_11]
MKKCSLCHGEFEVSIDEVDFLKKINFKFGDKTVAFLEPTQCPDCRNMIRTSHRNEQYLYQRKSDLSGKQLISLYDPLSSRGKNYTVYSQSEWHGDSWDSTVYGRDFDFSRSFFEQFYELNDAVPKMALIAVGNENSDFTTGTGYCKNCYLINSSEYCEDCYYGKLLQSCHDSVDCSYLYDSERCYECFSCRKCYGCVHVYYSQNCSDCFFSENLNGCKNCFLCTNLNNKEYYFMNQTLDKKEYQCRVEEFMGSYSNFKKASEILKKLRCERIHKYSNITNSENCTGDFIIGSRNCHNCYDMNDSEDCRNVWLGVQVKDVYDCSNMYIKPELNYQVMGTIETFHVAFSLYIFHSQNVLYSEQIHHSKDLFGCVGMKNKQYCILNKQYPKEEYSRMVERIVEHMVETGEWSQFFPPQYSPHGYNESLASEYYPLSKQVVTSRGWHWHEDRTQAAYQGEHYPISDNIKAVPEDIIQHILECEKAKKLYKIIPHELRFYKSMKVPIPRLCPDERHKNRMLLRNPRHLWGRKCAKCQSNIQTTYAPDRSEMVLCGECYLGEVY